jgi:hypothetical protein
MSKMLTSLLSGFRAIGQGLDMVCSSMFPPMPSKPPFDTIFFRSDKDALGYDWRCLCDDMQVACRDMKKEAKDVH